MQCLVLLADTVQEVLHPVHLVHCIIEEKLNIGHSAHLFADLRSKRLSEAGVTVAISEGLDRASASGQRNLPYIAAQAVAYGLPADAALAGITLVPAQLHGAGDRLGSIEVGKDASLFACTGDILDIRSEVRHLWIGGVEQSLESRHTRLADKYRARPKAK